MKLLNALEAQYPGIDLTDTTVVQGLKTKFTFPDVLENRSLCDVITGHVYTLEDIDSDGEMYFIDLAGEKNYAGMDDDSNGIIELVK